MPDRFSSLFFGGSIANTILELVGKLVFIFYDEICKSMQSVSFRSALTALREHIRFSFYFDSSLILMARRGHKEIAAFL